MNLKFLERFFLLIAFGMIAVSFIFAFEGLHYASDYTALWGGVVAIFSGFVNHSRVIADIKKELIKRD